MFNIIYKLIKKLLIMVNQKKNDDIWNALSKQLKFIVNNKNNNLN